MRVEELLECRGSSVWGEPRPRSVNKARRVLLDALHWQPHHASLGLKFYEGSYGLLASGGCGDLLGTWRFIVVPIGSVWFIAA